MELKLGSSIVAKNERLMVKAILALGSSVSEALSLTEAHRNGDVAFLLITLLFVVVEVQLFSYSINPTVGIHQRLALRLLVVARGGWCFYCLNLWAGPKLVVEKVVIVFLKK